MALNFPLNTDVGITLLTVIFLLDLISQHDTIAILIYSLI